MVVFGGIDKLSESSFRTAPLNPLLGITLKVLSTVAFTAMATLVKLLSVDYPVGQIVFFRSFFGLLPVIVWVAWRHEFRTVFHTANPRGHVVRAVVGGAAMFLSFAGLVRLPISDATAIGYTTPLVTVALAALLLGERVRFHRWSAVVIGLFGVLLILSDYIGGGEQRDRSLIGALFQFTAAVLAAYVAIHISRLARTENASTIVVYFFLFCSTVALATLPFGWIAPTGTDLIILIGTGIFGGLGQVLMTQSFRYAEATVLAPFDYAAMIWALLVGTAILGEVPTPLMLLGAAIVIASGLYVILRERHLGIARMPPEPAPPSVPFS